MKFVIETEDFWLGEDELEKKLKEEIIWRVVASINKSIEKKIDVHIERQVKNQIEISLLQNINLTIKEKIAKATVVDPHDRNKKITIEQFIVDEITNNRNGYSSIKSYIDDKTKKIGDDLKKRYDLTFAAQIVKRMSEHDLLKNDGIQKLLDDGGE